MPSTPENIYFLTCIRLPGINIPSVDAVPDIAKAQDNPHQYSRHDAESQVEEIIIKNLSVTTPAVCFMKMIMQIEH